MEELIGQVPYGAVIFSLVISIAALLSAVIPDEKMPSWLAKVLNFLAVNIGKAKNAPDQ